MRAAGERGDIVRTMQRALGGAQREIGVFEPGQANSRVIGRVAAKGLADELYDRGYLVIDGVDGKAHYVALPVGAELEHYPTGAVVEARGSADVRAADRTIAAMAGEGIYRTSHHLSVATAAAYANRDPGEVVAVHVRRLEALRRAGIVERVAKGVWRVPRDLPEQGRQYDARFGGVSVIVRSHVSIEQQTRAIGATWLDQQLVVGGKDLGVRGFGSEVNEALSRRGRGGADPGTAGGATPRHVAMHWAQRLKRVFGIDLERCEHCGGAVRIIRRAALDRTRV
jgi:hypothetical protein